MITAAVPITNRFTTFVIMTIPTFWLNVAVGIPPNRPPSMQAIPFPIIPPHISFSVASRSRPPPAVEVKSPIASTDPTIHMIVIDMIEVSSNLMPKCSGVVI